MRTPLSLLLLALLTTLPAAAQPQVDSSDVREVRYTRLGAVESDQASFWTGEKAEVGFYLVELENLTSGQTIRGVEVEVSRRETRQAGGSMALGSVGSLFGSSASVTYRRIRKSGYYFLRPGDLDRVVSFLDSVVVNLGQRQKRFSTWKVSIRDGFELGMQYDPDKPSTGSTPGSRPDWTFIVTAGEATYQLSYRKGVEVISTLTEWQGRVREGAP